VLQVGVQGWRLRLGRRTVPRSPGGLKAKRRVGLRKLRKGSTNTARESVRCAASAEAGRTRTGAWVPGVIPLRLGHLLPQQPLRIPPGNGRSGTATATITTEPDAAAVARAAWNGGLHVTSAQWLEPQREISQLDILQPGSPLPFFTSGTSSRARASRAKFLGTGAAPDGKATAVPLASIISMIRSRSPS